MVVVPISDVTHSMMDSARVGLDYIVENADYVEKLASALESKNYVVKKQVFELLSALSVYSAEGYSRTFQALEYFKSQTGERYRFKFIVSEVRNGPSVEYQTAVLAFINCLILATPELRERTRVRSEFIGLKLLHVLGDLRHRYKDYTDMVVQLDVFDEQRESDESQISPNSPGFDLSSPLEVFDAIIRQISDTPQEIPFLAILQHLLRIDSREPISDLIWDAAECLVHRATLLESSEDALRLLKAPSHAKSLHKLKESPPLPPAPPPPPFVGVAAPPPPPPPNGLLPGTIPHPPGSSITKPDESSNHRVQELPKLPQQTIPIPKSKMRTLNWNKIPSGQILHGDQNNIWATFAKNHSNGKVDMDWGALEGLFCIQKESNSLQGSTNTPFGVPRVDEIERRNSKRDEVTLLEAKRTLNINIFLKQFRSSNGDMIQLILDGSSDDFGAERLRDLLKILPSKDEIDMLNSVSPADQARLGVAEKFLLQIIKVKGYRLRIEAMLLKEEFETSIHSIELSINSILQAGRDVKTSQELQEVIFMILVAGNFLNSGGYAGDAAGVKLSSLQKVAEIRGNKPGFYLIHFIAMQAESRNPRLISFVDDMVALEEASKTSTDQLSTEISSLKVKVTNISQQMESPSVPQDIISQFSQLFKEASIQIENLRNHLSGVEDVRIDLARFFCEDLQTFKLEECFKILFVFTTRWKLAAAENNRRKLQEKEMELRKKTREDQLKKRSQSSWQNHNLAEEALLSLDRNKNTLLTPENDIFIACSPRVVRRRLGSTSEPINNSNGHLTPNAEHLTLPSPETTPNGSLRRRRSRAPSDDDESGLMDFLRSSGTQAATEKRPANEPYGSLDRSWSRKARRRPNLMDFVNDKRERPISPTSAYHSEPKSTSTTSSIPSDKTIQDSKHDSPTREWRKRISAWFVDLENGGSGEIPKRQPPPRRFQRRFGLDPRPDGGSRSLATLPEGDIGQEEDALNLRIYQRMYPDRRNSLTLNADIVSAMEAIEEVQSPTKEKSLWSRPSITETKSKNSSESIAPQPTPVLETPENSRRNLIESLGNQNLNEKLTLYIAPRDVEMKKSGGLESKRRSTNFLNRSIDPNAGTKEGFDRFASIRRSRRIKRPDTSSTFSQSEKTPVSGSPQHKFISKVDITSDPLVLPSNEIAGKHSATRDVKGPAFSAGQRRYSAIDSTLIKSSSQASNSVDNIKHDDNTLKSLSLHTTLPKPKATSPATGTGTERDEGFEESQSSISETNSQIDPNFIPRMHGLTRSRFRHSISEDGKVQPKSEGLWSLRANRTSTSTQPNRRKSLQENSPLGMNNKTNSRNSLLGSKGSIAMSSAKDPIESKSRKNSKSVDSSSTSKRNSNLQVKSNGSTPSRNILSHKNLKNKSSSVAENVNQPEKAKPVSKGLGPRLFRSFMMPTASSAAKDKLESAKSKGKSSKKSFK